MRPFASTLLLTLITLHAHARYAGNLDESVLQHFGGTLDSPPAENTRAIIGQAYTVSPIYRDRVPPYKEAVSLRDCELFRCKLVRGKLVFEDMGITSYNVTDANATMPKAYDGHATSEQVKDHPLLAMTEHGPVKGFYNHGLYRGVHHHLDIFRDNTPRAWLGIPFAQPPVHRLRFMPPRPYTHKWEPQVRQAYHTPKACPQAGFESYSDDCLYLNVYTPSVERMEQLGNKKLPVMFYIQGGGFNLGSSYMYGLYDGRHITKTQDVIVVVANHRLGVMGFLVADTTPPIKGNMAIQDQVMALEWVNRNIANFGGDPNNVSLVGLSSGATSVLIHLTSDKTPAHLFHKAILMSAPFAMYSRTKAEMEQVSLDFVKELGCPTDNTHSMGHCLTQMVSIKDLIHAGKQEPNQFSAANKATRPLSTHYYWWPHVDGDILKKEPLDAILAGEFKRVPIVMGVARDEMGYFTKFSSIPHADWITKLLGLRKFFTKDNLNKQRDELFKANSPLIQRYYPLTNDEKKNEMVAIQMATDAVFKCPTVQMADLLAQEKRQVYVYEIIKPADYLPLGRCSTDMVCHAFDIPYLFRPSFTWLSKDEIKLSNVFVQYLADFMAGDVDKRATVPWPRYSSEKKEYMNIAPSCALGHALRKDHCKEVWSKIGYKF